MNPPVEELIGWTRAELYVPGSPWITPNGDYRGPAQVDDLLQWLTHRGVTLREALAEAVAVIHALIPEDS